MNSDKPYKVLITDDDKFLLSMYAIKFRNEKFDVTTASNGAEALKILEGGFVPDGIILDVIMPVMDGLEFLEAMRAKNLSPTSTILVLSNQGQSSDIDKAKAFGIDGYIVKATTIPSEVVTEMTRMLGNRQKRMEQVQGVK
jgi:CheY-like chemotaxis protein